MNLFFRWTEKSISFEIVFQFIYDVKSTSSFWQRFLFRSALNGRVLNSLQRKSFANKIVINFFTSSNDFSFCWSFSVKTEILDKGANSSLLIAKINKSDSGNYSCFINATHEYTVSVHVLNGKPIRFQI